VYQLVERRAREIMLPVKVATRERGYRYYHGLRTVRIAENLIARSEELDRAEVDLFLVRCGGLLHDIAKGLMDGEHGEEGARLVREGFSDLLGAHDLDRVADIVRYHNKRDPTRDYPVEVKVIQDADLIDHLGAMEVWLAFHWSAARDEPVAESLRWFEGDRARSWWDYCLSHCNFELSRLAMERRLERFWRFLADLRRENDGELW